MKQITQHFGKQTVYYFGSIHKQTFYTPFKYFPINISVQAPFKYPLQNSSIFYIATIFNSYVKENEETCTTLFSLDDKLTIYKGDLQKNILYTFKIKSENENVRVAELYKYGDPNFVGNVVKGRVRKIKNALKISVKGTLHDFIPLKEYFDGEEVEALLIQSDGSKRVYRPVKMDNDFFDVEVYKENVKSLFCKNKYVHGVLPKCELNREVKVGDVLKVRALKENTYKYFFTVYEGEQLLDDENVIVNAEDNSLYNMNRENKGFTARINMGNLQDFNFVEGNVYEASIRNIHPIHGTFVSVNGFIGIMKKSETCKGFVTDIQMHLCGKSTVKGLMYNIDKDNKTFMFSVRKYEEIIDVSEGYFENQIINEDNKVSKENSKICNNQNRNLSSKENKTRKSDQENGKRFKEELHDSILFKKFRDINNLKGFKDWKLDEFLIEKINDFREYLEMNIEIDPTVLKIYIEVLLYLNEDVYSCVKKNIKTESIFDALIKICMNSLSVDIRHKILKHYYNKFTTLNVFKKYFTFLLTNKIEDPLIYKEIKYPKELVCSLYKIVPKEARVRIEQILETNMQIWESYLENEINNVDYCRNLYRRVTSLNWKADDAKKWFKRWLEFENLNNGNIEEVKEKAKMFVRKLKNEIHD